MRAARKVQAAQFAANIPPIIRDIQAAYTSLNVITGQLNARKVATANGGQCRRLAAIADDEAGAVLDRIVAALHFMNDGRELRSASLCLG